MIRCRNCGERPASEGHICMVCKRRSDIDPYKALIAMALQRRFGTGLAEIGHALGLVTLATSIGCLPVAGMLDRLLRRRMGLAARPLIMGLGAVALLIAGDLTMWIVLAFPIWVLVVSVLLLVRAGVIDLHGEHERSA